MPPSPPLQLPSAPRGRQSRPPIFKVISTPFVPAWDSEGFTFHQPLRRPALPHRRTFSQGDLVSSTSALSSGSSHAGDTAGGTGVEKEDERPMGLGKMLGLTCSMGGAQLAWAIEMAYGTPFLLSLDVPKTATAIVWMAGPISGLFTQPVIGALSDASPSRFRRRAYIAGGTAGIILTMLLLAFAREVARLLVNLAGSGEGDWDPVFASRVHTITILIAIASFVILDFCLNALQASLRALVLDVAPGPQQSQAMAWHGRFTHAANIVGYTLGFVDLDAIRWLQPLGDGQFRKLCLFGLVFLTVTVVITCVTQEEQPRDPDEEKPGGVISNMFRTIVYAVTHLPKPVRRVCYVQVFAFMGWFPFLFYSTTYMAEIMADSKGRLPDPERATRAGSFALLLYAIVAMVAGTILPHLSKHQPEPPSSPTEHPPKLDKNPFTLRNIWTGALLLFTGCMFSTFWIQSVQGATIMMALVGIPWAVSCWVPFAILGEVLKELADETNSEPTFLSPSRTPIRRAASMPGPLFAYSPASPISGRRRAEAALGECAPLLPDAERGEYAAYGRDGRLVNEEVVEEDEEEEDEDVADAPKMTGGTVLGIHNLAIVSSQLIVAIVSSIIFRIVAAASASESSSPHAHLFQALAGDDDMPGGGGGGGKGMRVGSNGVAWVLRFGGVAALIAAGLSRRVPRTRVEKLEWSWKQQYLDERNR